MLTPAMSDLVFDRRLFMARGTVRSRSSGSWEIRWEVPRGENGERNSKVKFLHGTRSEAEAELRKILADLQQKS